VRLAQDDIEEALAEFEREGGLAEPHRLYGREYALHAALGRGAALLRARRREEAITSFRAALAFYPDHPLGHLGLAVAGNEGFGRVDAALKVLDRTKPIESALVRAQSLAAQGHGPAAADLLAAALKDAPPGFAGWSLPVEPLLLQATDKQALTPVFALLADRAR
jgi:tetratricopeptide (TPR) repeat protein